MKTLQKLDREAFKERLGGWYKYFEPIFETEIMDEIFTELKELGTKKTICPDSKNTFRSFATMPPEKLKVMFVLLDPYPTIRNKIKVSNGIAMDCSNTEVLQPSLEKWYDAIEKELSEGLDLNMERNASLQYYIDQGVMFFNTALTVEANKTGSHTELWAPFMRYFYEEVMGNFKEKIYVLCGKESQKMKRWIDPLANYVIEIEHPAFAARQYRDWDTKGAFKKINWILRNNKQPEIEWVNPSNMPF